MRGMEVLAAFCPYLRILHAPNSTPQLQALRPAVGGKSSCFAAVRKTPKMSEPPSRRRYYQRRRTAAPSVVPTDSDGSQRQQGTGETWPPPRRLAP
ncbi:hypothetical protein C0Q70_19957 [Pomacea canaliculata]|uniref:Uncharacterized protein n=1 Tax=Pomacea canaliculata TaxID=400727 RepID=A0A2T7NE64_POMCA|nr:hypothetical protein C0Q70_19957 [Pomacea canaliculata]